MSTDVVDVVVIGSGPNGLVSAITLAEAGFTVRVVERAPVAGGAVRSEELTKPGYIHDTFSAFYGLLHSTPVFRDLRLGERIAWANFDTVVGAATDPNTGAAIYRDLDRTRESLQKDGDAWAELMQWWDKIGTRFFAQMLAPIGAPLPALRFLRAAKIKGSIDAARMMLAPVEDLANERFATDIGRALFACGISHTDLGVDAIGSTPMSIILAMLAQTVGMPVPVGGAGKLTEGLLAILDEEGGTVTTGDAVTRVIVERGRARAVETASGAVIVARHAVVADTGAVALFRDLVGEDHFTPRFLDGLRRFRYGTGMFKCDFALDGPVPWTHEEFRSCGVVHLTGDMTNMARASFDSHRGLLPETPMLIVGQQTVADPTRAPRGMHTLWVETHVPPHPTGDAKDGSSHDGWQSARKPFFDRIIARIDEHAPGFRERIVGWAVHTPNDLEAANPNLVGGDVNGGSAAIDMQLVFRPVPGWFRYRTPVKGLYLCSASAHPGGGVHGMGGRNCARRVIRDTRRPRAIARTATGARRRPL